MIWTCISLMSSDIEHLCMRPWLAGALSAAERSYPTSEVRDNSIECQAVTVRTCREELPSVRHQGRRQGGDTPASEVGAVAKRSYPASEASGGREETPRVRGQGQPGEAISCPRPGAVTLRSPLEPKARCRSWEGQPGEATSCLRPGPAARRSNPRSGGCAGAGGPRGAIPH